LFFIEFLGNEDPGVIAVFNQKFTSLERFCYLRFHALIFLAKIRYKYTA
jgi:hypothetical protein